MTEKPNSLRLAMPSALTTLAIITRFNQVVRDPIVTNFPAVWSTANQNPIPAVPVKNRIDRHNPTDFGANAEPVFTVADIPNVKGEHAIISIFYVLHNLAMRLTRVRMARDIHIFGTGGGYNIIVGAPQRAALKAGFELYFDIPAVPNQGDVITMNELNIFLTALYNLVQARRTDVNYSHLFVAATCHGNCHGSRGRR